MNFSLWWSNLVSYSLQVGLLVGAATMLALLFRIGEARMRLWYWHALLALCLLLPVLEPWRGITLAPVEISPAPEIASPALPPLSGSRWPSAEMLLSAIFAGVLLRAAWLGLGLWRLHRYRRRSRAFTEAPEEFRELRLCLNTYPFIGVSEELPGPVTFGVLRPVVLLPAAVLSLPRSVRRAVVCHEFVHIRRRDWAVTAAEECIRAILWFHPAVWWILSQVQLAREQVVDQEALAVIGSREQYADALLAVAGAKPQLDLAPAPLFLRKRHLVARVASIFSEVTMSTSRLILVFTACCGLLLAVAWLAAGSFPLQAAPQAAAADAPGVSIEPAGASLLHRTPIAYPQEAREKHIEGAVVLELAVDEDGRVSDARVLSGPQELRRAALESVLQWHYAKSMPLPARVQVTVNFKLGEESPVQPPAAARSGSVRGDHSAATTSTLQRIEIQGLSSAARDALMARLPVHVGDPISLSSLDPARKVVQEFDEHLRMVLRPDPRGGGATLRILLPAAGPAERKGAPEPAVSVASAPGEPPRIRVGGNVQQNKLVSQTAPIYPALAKQAGVQGIVTLEAVIGKSGAVENLQLLSGHPLLAPAAMEAVRQWVYQPTLLNGQPVEVITHIDVNFTLAK